MPRAREPDEGESVGRGEGQAGAQGAARPGAPNRSLRIGRNRYPVVLPSWKDPRLHVSATFILLHALGQIEFHFQLSFPQIACSILTCALIEVVVTFWQKRVIFWPASALLTGNGIA